MLCKLRLSAAVLPFLALPAIAQDAVATVNDADDDPIGTVTFQQTPHGVIISAELQNLEPGAHGFHIHEVGDCSGDFSAAGGHYAPGGNAHGFMSEDGYHAGDLPNIHVAQDGTATADFFTTQISLEEGAEATLFDDDGSAIMVHTRPDDYQDVDSAGGRVACGVIEPS